MRLAGALERLSTVGAAAQVSVPGVYAWGVTVAPSAWARSASSVTRVAVLAALVALAAGVAGERRWGDRARFGSLWGCVIASGIAWLSAPAAFAPPRMDVARGLAGMLGWALFAFAAAAPSLHGRREQARVVGGEPPLLPRRPVVGGSAAYVALGGALAFGLELFGWQEVNPERALLVRAVAVAAGLALFGATSEMALARQLGHAGRAERRQRVDGLLAVLFLVALLAAGRALRFVLG